MNPTRPRPVLLAFLFLVPLLAGCLENGGYSVAELGSAAGPQPHFLQNTPWPKNLSEVRFVERVWIPVSLPAESLGAAAVGIAPRIHAGAWNATNLNGAPAPTVVVFSADHGEGPDELANQPGRRLGRALVERLTPEGFNVVQVAALGTSFSNHCVDFLGDDDRISIEAALGWVLEQTWSNGDVFVAGEGYGGAMAWMASHHPAVRGVVAVDAPTSAESWLWHHGAPVADAWTRHLVEYGPRSINSRPVTEGGGTYVEGKDVQAACTSMAEAVTVGPSHDAPAAEYLGADAYLQERNWTQRIEEGLQVPALILHGMGEGKHPASTAERFAHRIATKQPVDFLLGAWTPGAIPAIEEPESMMPTIGDAAANWLLEGQGRQVVGLETWTQDESGSWFFVDERAPQETYSLAGMEAAAPDQTVYALALDLDGVAGSVVDGDADLHFTQTISRAQAHVRLLDVQTGSTLAWGVAASSDTSSLRVPIEPTQVPPSFAGQAVLEVRVSSSAYMAFPDAAPLALLDMDASELTLNGAGAN